MKINLVCIISVQFLLTIIFLQCAIEQKLSQFQFWLMNIDRQLPQDTELNAEEKKAFDAIKSDIERCINGIFEHFTGNWKILRDIIDDIGSWFHTNVGPAWWVANHGYQSIASIPKYPKKNELQQHIKNSYEVVMKKLEALSVERPVPVIKKSVDMKLTPIQERMFRWLQQQNNNFDQKVRQVIYDNLKIINGIRDARIWASMTTLHSYSEAFGKKKDWQKLGIFDVYENLNGTFMGQIVWQLLCLDYSDWNKFEFVPSSLLD